MKFYIDPGTGSMLFTILLGIIGASLYSIRMFIVKLRNGILGKSKEKMEEVIPFAIYSDDKRYWNIFEPVCREMNRLNKEIVYLTASEDDPVFECPYENVKAKCIGKGNKSFAYLNYFKATILLSTTPGLDVYQWKRSADVAYYVHILHSAGEITMYRMFGIDYYDAVLVAADFHIRDIRDLEALRKLPEKEVVKIGLPFMDEMLKRVENDTELHEHERTVLLAPSWGSNSIFNVYGEKIVELLLNTGYHIIIRPHPQSFSSEKELIDSLLKKYPASDRLEWNRDNDNYDVLRRSDILISDFSGVIYDFALVHDKPVIYTNPNMDLSVYDAWWLDRPLNKAEFLPLIGRELNSGNVENIKSLIDECLDDPKYSEGRAYVKEKSWANIGEGAERTVQYLLDKYAELTGGES